MTMTSEPVFAPARLALLLLHFSEINDDRESWRVAYPLKEVLLLVSCARQLRRLRGDRVLG
jgi:hypothetical protein